MIEPIDYCTIFSGKNPVVLAQVCYKSLFKTTDLTGITFHVINQGCSEEEIREIKKILSKVDNPCYFHDSPKPVTRRGPGDENDTSNHDNVALNSDFAISKCGTNQWCVLAHFDIEYKKDFISFCRPFMKPTVGFLGQHERFMLVNRKAYKQSSVKFITIAPFMATLADEISGPHNNEYQIRYIDDNRIAHDAFRIRGFDNGELLELELRAYGWDVIPFIDELREYISHFGGGSDNNEIKVHSMRDRAIKALQVIESKRATERQIDLMNPHSSYWSAPTVIHLHISGQVHAACLPGISYRISMTGDPRAVTCPQCKLTPQYKQAQEALPK